MPEIDTELFQQIALGGLLLLLIVGLLILNSLTKLRKAVEQGAGGRHLEEPATLAEAEPQPIAETQPQPATGGDVYAQPWGEPAAEPTTAGFDLTPAPAAEPIPEEQPFERDGRWWFKRGSELLVYDEATGQWTPAPSDTPFAVRSEGGVTTETPTPGAGGIEGTGFWKCPSCGAVNGATSATCRMCFTPRPA